MNKKAFIIIIFTFIFISCSQKISLPENFNVKNMETVLIIDKPVKFLAGFVNPSYYFSDKTKNKAEKLVNKVKPVETAYELIQKHLKAKFRNTGIKINKTLTKNIPHINIKYNGPENRAPVINPEIDIDKLKDKVNSRYIMLFRIRDFRLELDARPGVKQRFIINPAIAIYDIQKKKKIYLWYLGLDLQSRKMKIHFRLKGFSSSEQNVKIMKSKLDILIKKCVSKLTRCLIKNFSPSE